MWIRLVGLRERSSRHPNTPRVGGVFSTALRRRKAARVYLENRSIAARLAASSDPRHLALCRQSLTGTPASSRPTCSSSTEESSWHRELEHVESRHGKIGASRMNIRGRAFASSFRPTFTLRKTSPSPALNGAGLRSDVFTAGLALVCLGLSADFAGAAAAFSELARRRVCRRFAVGTSCCVTSSEEELFSGVRGVDAASCASLASRRLERLRRRRGFAGSSSPLVERLAFFVGAGAEQGLVVVELGATASGRLLAFRAVHRAAWPRAVRDWDG